MKNEILYQIITNISDLFNSPSAHKQKQRYLKRYGIQDEDVFFLGKGFWTDACVLRGRNFYKRLQEMGESRRKKIKK